MMNDKILCIDDEVNVLEGFQRNLRKQFSIDIAVGGKQGLQMMEEKGPYAVVVTDMQMPEMNGIEFLMQAESKAPDTVRLMLTGNADLKTATDAVNEGHIFRFLNKPCSPESLAVVLNAGIRQYRLVVAERELLEKTLSGSIKVLSEILAMVEPQALGYAQKIVQYIHKMAPVFKINNTWELEVAAMLAPIGYLTLPDSIASRVRNDLVLSDKEQGMLNRIPEIGCRLLEHIPRLESVAKIVFYQNKNFNGTGYPKDPCSGNDIPFGARILKVLSDFVRLEAKGDSPEAIFNKLSKRQGSYDPQILETMQSCLLAKDFIGKENSKIRTPIAVKDLKEGQILAASLQTVDEILIAPEGSTVSQVLLEKLKNFSETSRISEPIYVYM